MRRVLCSGGASVVPTALALLSVPAAADADLLGTTTGNVTASVNFEARCAAPGSTEAGLRVATAEVTLLRRQGNAFSFDIAGHRRGSAPWTGTLTGTVSPTAIALDVRASATIDGETCDTGALSLKLNGRAE